MVVLVNDTATSRLPLVPLTSDAPVGTPSRSTMLNTAADEYMGRCASRPSDKVTLPPSKNLGANETHQGMLGKVGKAAKGEGSIVLA